ncbi:hypothetical protein GBA52_008448 [Prunus armeniaca]|nr:hypothetical protein GBA52_008448 [Prunus armeniaca]
MEDGCRIEWTTLMKNAKECRRVRHLDTRTRRGYASDTPWSRVNAFDTIKRLLTRQTHGQDTAGNF